MTPAQLLEASGFAGWTIGAFLLGMASSFMATRVYESLKTPRLRIVVGGHTPESDHRLLHLRVENPAIWWRLSPRPAADSTAALHFTRSDGTMLSIPARWTETPTPTPNEAYLGGRLTILPRGKGNIPVAIKVQGQNHCYAYANRSCFGAEIEEWILDGTQILLRCEVRSGETGKTGVFLISNPGSSVDEFSIHPR